MSSEFFDALSRGTPLIFQTFPDAEKDKSDPERRRALTRVLPGSYAQHERQLRRLNEQGAGVYVAVNAMTGNRRRLSDLQEVRAYYADVDGLDQPGKEELLDRLLDAALPANMIVESKNGLHAYWLTHPGEAFDAELWALVQAGLRVAFGGDERCKDAARVLRVPGYAHLKDPEDPFEITLLHLTPDRYVGAEVLAAYPAPESARPRPATRTEWKPVGRTPLAKLDRLAEHAALRWGQGSRHALALALATKMYFLNVPEAEAASLVERIARSCGDEDVEDRLQAVQDTYRRAREGQPVSAEALRGVRLD